MTVPRIGLIARAEYARGLAIQSKNFYDHMPVAKTLVVQMPNPDCALRMDWYHNPTVLPSLPGHVLDEWIVRHWMSDLDVVFSVETPYDWSLPRWAREMGVKTVIQGNPEFVRHGQAGYEHFEHPDEWWWPTRWRMEHLPAGVHMPVPMPDHPKTCANPHEGPLKVYHIAGKRAFADRNGTDIVINALRVLNKSIRVNMHGLEHSLPEIEPVMNLDVNVEKVGVPDLWDMHTDQHILVMPRRYGGLCLPALEAASRGIAVMMPECSPNDELSTMRIVGNPGRHIRVACGQIPTVDIHHYALAQEINQYVTDRALLAEKMQMAYDRVPRWSEWRQKYIDQFARVCES